MNRKVDNYNNQKWYEQTLKDLLNGYALDDLNDVVITSKTYGDFLGWNNVAWVNTRSIGDGTNSTEFEADGTMKMNGSATCYTDLIGSITSIQVQGSGVSLNAAEQSIDFTTGANLLDYAWISFQMKHEWKMGSNIFPHLHWTQNSANTPNFLIRYRWQRNGQTKTTAWTNYKCNTNAFTYTSGSLNQISYGAAITPPTGYSISDIVQIRIFRDNGNTSTLFTGTDVYTGDAQITSSDIHIESDTLGSRTEFTK